MQDFSRAKKPGSREADKALPVHHLQPTVGKRAAVSNPDSRQQTPDTARNAFTVPRFGHDFSRISVWPAERVQADAKVPLRTPGQNSGLAHSCTRVAVAETPKEDDDKPNDPYARAQAPAPPAPAPPAPAPPAPAPPTLSASLAITGDTFSDTATESSKKVKFNATWKGGAKEDYIIVNWLKGYIKDTAGTPYKVMMYGSPVDFNFSSWQVDSVDPDPAYWSSGGTRWNYNVDGPNAFHATDKPAPPGGSMKATDVGSKASVDFKTAVYKSSEVPTTTTGTIAATPLTSFQPWSYHTEVLAGGKFEHNGLSRGAKTAIGIGGGALVGAGIGALVGGPVGAAVGAGAGALVGGIGSLFF